MAPKPETKLRSKIVKAIEREYPQDYVAHPHGSMYGAGMLDLVVGHQKIVRKSGVIVPLCLFVSFEIKMPNRRNNVSDTQQKHIDRIRNAGGIAEVITSADEALEVLRGI